MVAAHASDLHAAAALGLRPVFVRRSLEWGADALPADAPALDGLLATEGLVDLAEALAADDPSTATFAGISRTGNVAGLLGHKKSGIRDAHIPLRMM